MASAVRRRRTSISEEGIQPQKYILKEIYGEGRPRLRERKKEEERKRERASEGEEGETDMRERERGGWGETATVVQTNEGFRSRHVCK